MIQQLTNYLVQKIITDIQMKGTQGKYPQVVKNLWDCASGLAERLAEKDSAEYDILQEKLYFAFMRDIKTLFEP